MIISILEVKNNKYPIMISGSKVTEIFCIADDFCREFEVEMAKNALPSTSDAPKRKRKRMMPDTEVITILICFHFNSFRNFKHYYTPSHTTVLSRLCQDVLLCNEKGEIINFVLTKANVDDRNEKVIDSLTDKVIRQTIR